MFPVSSILLFSFFILHTGVTSDQVNDDERNALVKFMSQIKYSPYKFRGWKEYEPACFWPGVACNPDNSTIVYLRLPASSLVGEIPPNTIGMLTNLRVLSLRWNSLYGTIPPDFARLTSLTHLYLDHNNFSGQLPSIGGEYLTSFNISYNNLNTSIPTSLSKFPQSAFFNNSFVCGKPFPQCMNQYPHPQPDKLVGPQDDTQTENREIVGVSMGSGTLFLIFLCSLGKKTYQRIKPSLSKADQMESNKLVAFDGDFDSEDLLKSTAEILGEGSFGVSYKHMLVGKNTVVVVKRLKDVVVTEKEFREKMEDLGRMKNKYLVPLKGFYNYSNHEKWLVYDYMPAGSLSDHLHGT